MKYCIVPDLHGGGSQEYILGTYPNAEAECINNGGRVEDRESGGCGSTKSVQAVDAGAPSSAAAAVVAPVQQLRDRLPVSPLLRDLAVVNYSPDLLKALDQDDALREHVREAVGTVSQFALLALVDPESPTLTHAHYTDELHAWFVRLGEHVQKYAEDEAVREAIDRIRKALEAQVGEPIGALVARAFDDAGTGTGTDAA